MEKLTLIAVDPRHTISPFTSNDPTEWLLWTRHCAGRLYINKDWTSQEKKKKINDALEANSMVVMAQIGQVIPSSTTDLLRQLTSYIMPGKGTKEMYLLIAKMKQLKDESIVRWHARLDITLHWAFDDYKDNDRQFVELFIKGIRDPTTRQKAEDNKIALFKQLGGDFIITRVLSGTFLFTEIATCQQMTTQFYYWATMAVLTGTKEEKAIITMEPIDY